MRQPVDKVISILAGEILHDDTWQCIGFGNRPRIGAAFQHLRPLWLKDLDNRILQELLATFVVAYVKAGRLLIEDIAQVVSAFTNEYSMYVAFGYESSITGRRELLSAISAYQETPMSGWRNAIRNRLSLESVQDEELRRRLWLGGEEYEKIMIKWVQLNRVNYL